MMSISRNSAIAGYDRLLDEGYILTRKGSGTYVSHHIPDRSISNSYPEMALGDVVPPDEQVHSRNNPARDLWSNEYEGRGMNRLFAVGVGCTDLFPACVMGKATATSLETIPASTGSSHSSLRVPSFEKSGLPLH